MRKWFYCVMLSICQSYRILKNACSSVESRHWIEFASKPFPENLVLVTKLFIIFGLFTKANVEKFSCDVDLFLIRKFSVVRIPVLRSFLEESEAKQKAQRNINITRCFFTNSQQSTNSWFNACFQMLHFIVL